MIQLRSLLFFLLMVYCKSMFGQDINNCQLLEKFLNLPEVFSSFDLNEKSDSLILIDKKNDFAQFCNSISWGKKYMLLKFDTIVSQQIKKRDPYLLFKDSCTVYIIDQYSQIGTTYYFSILQPCSNLLTKGRLRLLKGKYKIIEIKKYVL